MGLKETDRVRLGQAHLKSTRTAHLPSHTRNIQCSMRIRFKKCSGKYLDHKTHELKVLIKELVQKMQEICSMHPKESLHSRCGLRTVI